MLYETMQSEKINFTTLKKSGYSLRTKPDINISSIDDKAVINFLCVISLQQYLSQK